MCVFTDVDNNSPLVFCVLFLNLIFKTADDLYEWKEVCHIVQLVCQMKVENGKSRVHI